MKFMFNGKELFIDNFLAQKLDIISERITKHKFDCLLLLDGNEGYGKSNLAATCCAYVSYKTGRSLTNKNVFFQVDDMLKYATETKEQIIWWDEAALGGLASESYNKIQVKLLKLLYVARKKQHFYCFCIPKFYKLKEPIVDRAVGLLHVYSRDEITRGYFTYYRRKNKDDLYLYWKTKKQQGYRRFYNFAAPFKEALPDIIDEKIYDSDKDKAILSIAAQETDKISKLQQKYHDELVKLYQIIDKNKLISTKELSKALNVSQRNIQRRISMAKGGVLGGNDGETVPTHNIIVKPEQDVDDDEGEEE